MSKRGFAVIGLNNPKSNVNVGGVLRAIGCYQADLLIMTGNRYKRSKTDTMATYRHIPFIQTTDLHDSIPYDCVPVAVDLLDNARSLVNYIHPERAFYIFGQEDGTLGKKITSWCRDKIYIPGNACMNLASTVNVVLYDRMSKKIKGKAK